MPVITGDGQHAWQQITDSNAWEQITDSNAWEQITDSNAWEQITDSNAWEQITDSNACKLQTAMRVARGLPGISKNNGAPILVTGTSRLLTWESSACNFFVIRGKNEGGADKGKILVIYINMCVCLLILAFNFQELQEVQ